MTMGFASNDDDLLAIRSASSVKSLSEMRMRMQEGLMAKYSGMDIHVWNRFVSNMHDTVMSRAASLCEDLLESEGAGLPPAPYALITFGSSGRQESTLWSDQDNGLIFGTGSGGDSSGNEAYFEKFSIKLSAILEKVGYPPCPGNVMLSNPMWRHHLSGWEHQLRTWRSDLNWEQVRYLMIMLDMRHIHGDVKLSLGLHELMMDVLYNGRADTGERTQDFTTALLRNTIRHKSALNVLGQVITEQSGEHTGDFDVKYGLYLPMVNGIRYLAMQHGVDASSTFERIQELTPLEEIVGIPVESCLKAMETALWLRILADGSNYLPHTLLKHKNIKPKLREALMTVRQLYRGLQRQHRYAERKWL